MYTFDYNQDYSEIIDANATCEWISEDPVYRAWKQEASSQILHVVGKPGQGKTVLAKYITRRLSDEGSIKGIHSRALYYFCNSRKHAQETASSILQAMIHQILEDIPSLVETFLKSCGTMSNHPFSTTVSKGGWSLQALCKAFLDMIAASKLELVFCVIDALDENDRDSVEEFLRMLVTGLSNMDSNGTNLKVIITSRPEDYIMDELTEHPHIRIAVQTVQKDIQTVVQGRLVKLRKRLRLKLQEEADLQAELVRRAEGTLNPHLIPTLSLLHHKNESLNLTRSISLGDTGPGDT